MYYVYFILNKDCSTIKIGFSDDVKRRCNDLQGPNSSLLTIENVIECNSEKSARDLERMFHDYYENYHVRGEWFTSESIIEDFEYFDNIEFLNETLKENKKNGGIEVQTLEGTKTVLRIKDYPRCFFYTFLPAQIMTSKEKAFNKKNPFRTFKYPTKNKFMLFDNNGKLLSDEKDRVYISSRFHNQYRALMTFKKDKRPTSLWV